MEQEPKITDWPSGDPAPSIVLPGPPEETHQVQEMLRSRWANEEHTLVRFRTPEAHYVIGPDHPRWEEATLNPNPYIPDQPEEEG